MTKELQKVWIDGKGRRRETVVHKQTVTVEFPQQSALRRVAQLVCLCFWLDRNHVFDGAIGACRKCGKPYSDAAIDLE